MPKPVLHKVLFFTSVSTSVKKEREIEREGERERAIQSSVILFFMEFVSKFINMV